jgi:hypothetical protein
MEGLNFNEGSIERQKYHFVYTNIDISDHPVIFECDAFDMKEADKLYEEKVGKRPDKGGSIALSII